MRIRGAAIFCPTRPACSKTSDIFERELSGSLTATPLTQENGGMLRAPLHWAPFLFHAMAARRPERTRAPATVSWTSDDGETVEMPPGVTPADTAAATAPQPRVNGSADHDGEPETATDRVVEMIVKNRGGDRSKVKVWKVLENGELSFCNDYAPDLFEQQNLNLIRRQFGAGKYRIEIYAHNPISKRFSCFGRETVNIEDVHQGNDPEDIAERIAQMMGAQQASAAPAAQPRSNLEQLKEMV